MVRFLKESPDTEYEQKKRVCDFSLDNIVHFSKLCISIAEKLQASIDGGRVLSDTDVRELYDIQDLPRQCMSKVSQIYSHRD